MTKEQQLAKDTTPTVLRLPPDIRAELMQLARQNDRSLSKEITIRLRVSLGAQGPTLQGILAREAGLAPAKESKLDLSQGHQPTVMHTNDNGPAHALTDADRAMLEVFRKMPVDKQLALLSLFR